MLTKTRKESWITKNEMTIRKSGSIIGIFTLLVRIVLTRTKYFPLFFALPVFYIWCCFRYVDSHFWPKLFIQNTHSTPQTQYEQRKMWEREKEKHLEYICVFTRFDCTILLVKGFVNGKYWIFFLIHRSNNFDRLIFKFLY